MPFTKITKLILANILFQFFKFRQLDPGNQIQINIEGAPVQFSSIILTNKTFKNNIKKTTRQRQFKIKYGKVYRIKIYC